ncbi:CHAT domain-containing protein [Pseudomonas moorei]|uniref:CHAT domain-containing protein n=1 Tax=Pseudomonas moorei TaxID=395599 RepID=UPI0036F385E4
MRSIRLGLGVLAAVAVLLSGEAQAGKSTTGARNVAYLVQMGEWERGAEEVALVLPYLVKHRRDPDAVPAAILMASSLSQLGRHAEAQRLLAPLGSSAEVVAARGTIFLKQGNYSEASATLASALQEPSSLPRVAQARVLCERAFLAEQTGDAAAASAGYLDALKLYVAAAREQTFFLGAPRVEGTLWDEVAPKPRIVPGPVGDVIAELDRLGEPNANPNYHSDSFSAYLEEEYLDNYPRAAPFVDCLVWVARNKEAAGEQELAHAIFQTAIAQSSLLDSLSYTHQRALAFIEYFEFLERANFDPDRLVKLVRIALNVHMIGDLKPAYSESDIRNPGSPTTSPRMKAFQVLSGIILRALLRSGSPSDIASAFEVEQDYQSSSASLAVHVHTERLVHPRYSFVSKAEHNAFWAQFDRDLPPSYAMSALPPLGPRQLLIMISPDAGAGIGRIWAIGEQRKAWAALGTDRETLRTDIENLRCALDVVMCCEFPEDSRMGAAYGRLKKEFIAEFQLESVGRCPLRNDQFEATIAYRVFDEIFADPIIREMVTKADEIIIVPQGEYASIPFGALPMDRPQAGRGPAPASSTKWLGLEKAISIYPSIYSYVDSNSTEHTYRKIRLFGVGDPLLGTTHTSGRAADCAQFALRSRRVRGGSAGDPMLALLPLPGTRCELQAISKLKGVAASNASRLLLRDSATERRVRAAARTNRPLSQAEVLMFATHGLMRGDFGLEEPALVLSRPRRNGPADNDGFLTLSEIMQMQMQAWLVILSACNTGSSGEAAGDALASFATAFFRAGAESVLLSQWTVRDDVAAFVTPRLVALMLGEPTIAQCQRGDGGRRSTAEALRMALCEARQNEALGADLPGDWAPFVLVGGKSQL